MSKKIKLKAEEHTIKIDGNTYVYEKSNVERGQHSEEITLKMMDKEVYEKDIKDTAKKLAKSVNSQELIEDVLRTSPYEQVRRIKRMVNKGAKVKSKEGCFFLDIGGKEKLYIR